MKNSSDRQKPKNTELQAKTDVLRELEPTVESLMEEHVQKRQVWYPGDFLPAYEQTDDDEDQQRANLQDRVQSISDPARVSVALNLLTEEGLPHFHRILSTYLGSDNIWSKWNFLWTAEEDRHGNVLRDYVREARLFRFREVEELQFDYQQSGFTPDWDKDPYRVFVYTTLQERATQIAHSNTGKQVGNDEPLLGGILRQVAADEARHYAFYRKIFKSILEIDPNRALESALQILPSIDMPGLSIPGFKKMADTVRRTGIYGPWEYKAIVEEAVGFWGIDNLSGLNARGRKARDKIMELPARLEKVAKYIERKSTSKTFSFDFLYNRQLIFE